MSATKHPIFVTGASGFFASELILQLLKAGYKVKASVRANPSDSKYDWVRHIAGEELSSNIELVAADLLTENVFDDLVGGCEYVMHTASPYSFKVDDPQRDLVDPALQGTLNVLRSVAKANAAAGEDGVKCKRLILTSSVGAVNVQPEGDKVYSEEVRELLCVKTEEDWNSQSSLENNPYAYSKTLAEQAAWDFVKGLSDAEKFDMVVINPSTIIGRGHHKSHVSNPSLDLMARVVSELPGILKFSYYLVDVVDCAGAHIMAMEKPEAKGRYICHAKTVWMKEVLDIIHAREGFEKYKTPALPMSGHCTTWFTKNVGSYFYPKQEGVYIRNQLGLFQQYNTDKIKALYEFRDIKDTLYDTIDFLIEHGRVKEPEKK